MQYLSVIGSFHLAYCPQSFSVLHVAEFPSFFLFFFFKAEYYSIYEYSTFSLSIHLLMDILGCFYILAIVNNAVNIRANVSSRS